MGQSSSNKKAVDPNYESFTFNINQLKVEPPKYKDLQQEFRTRFPIIAWNQALWSIDEAVKSYKNDISYTSWKATYKSINSLKICVLIISTIPFCISVATLIASIFVLFWSIFLTATGTDNSFYVWISIYNLLSLTHKIIIIGSYIITFIGVIILYFTYKSLKPLKKQYAQIVARHISLNLMLLNRIYNNTIQFSMEWIRINKSLMICKCYGECNIGLIGYITIKILTEAIEPIDDLLVMNAFMVTANAESSQSDAGFGAGCNLMRVKTRSPSYYNNYEYIPVDVVEGGDDEGGDIQTDISIEISIADINNLL